MTDWRQGTVGGMNWSAALGWAADLTLGGYDDWRLPRVGSPGCQAYNCVNGELGYLWYTVLDNVVPRLSNRGPFMNMASAAFWTGTGFDADQSWAFATGNGFQAAVLTSNRYAVVAVRDGDTLANAVPEPSTTALMIAALLAAGSASRHRSVRFRPSI